jgi:hypothetical protein
MNSKGGESRSKMAAGVRKGGRCGNWEQKLHCKAVVVLQLT